MGRCYRFVQTLDVVIDHRGDQGEFLLGKSYCESYPNPTLSSIRILLGPVGKKYLHRQVVPPRRGAGPILSALGAHVKENYAVFAECVRDRVVRAIQG